MALGWKQKKRKKLGRRISRWSMLCILLCTVFLLNIGRRWMEVIYWINDQENLKYVSEVLADNIDGDVLRAYSEDGQTNETVDRIHSRLEKFREEMELEAILIADTTEEHRILMIMMDDHDLEQKLLGKELNVSDIEMIGYHIDPKSIYLNDSELDLGNKLISSGTEITDQNHDPAAILIMVDRTDRFDWVQIIYVVGQTVIMVLGMLAVLLTVQICISRLLSRPMSRIIHIVENYHGEGTIQPDKKLMTGDEIQTLYEAFCNMAEQTDKYAKDLAAIAGEQEHINTELSIAATIQAGMLPSVFPPYPERTDLDIYALMEPAKEVGGDFYDFFLLDPDHLAMVIADVSGKGVPSALFMVIAKTLIRGRLSADRSLDEVLKHVNNELCGNNSETLFVTAWLAILDVKTGTLTWCNAGHNHPLILRADGSVSWIDGPSGVVLAALEDMEYESATLTMQPGDKLLLYTDGVTEAMNEQEIMFGDDRLYETMSSCTQMNAQETVSYLREEISGFVKDAEQFDDITILTVGYQGTQKG